MDKILKLLEQEVVTDCKKMSSHIDFIENVYSNVKSPMYYIVNKINTLTRREIKYDSNI